MRYVGSVLVLLFVFCLGAGPVVAGEFPVTVDETVLSNGLKVFCLKRPGNPQSACMLAVRTGSSSEVKGKTGIAHFLEHMLFKGTDKIGVKDPEKDRKLRGQIDEVMAKLLAGEDGGASEADLAKLRAERDGLFAEQQENLVLNHVFRIYSDAGGSMTNAFTSQDMTAYFSILPNHKIELFFWVESERFRNPVFRQFHSEKNVVREERRLSENRPGHAFAEEFDRVLFGDHPYGTPVIGYHEDLRRLTRKQMRAFFDHFYSPDNMVLMVAGDVESQRVFELAEKYFGDWEAMKGQRYGVPPLAPVVDGPKRVEGTGKGPAELTIAFALPPAGSTEDVPASLLAMHLSDEQGALRKQLVEKRRIATGVSARYDGMLHGSTFSVTVTMKDGHAPEEAEAIVLAAIQELVAADLSDERMATLRRRYRARTLGMVKSDMMLGFRFLRNEMSGSWKNIERDLEFSRTVGADDVRTMAMAFLYPENRVTGLYRNATTPPASEASGKPDHWSKLEFPRMPLELPSAAPYVTRLANGATFVMVPDGDDPVFRVEAILRGGSAEDEAGREGTAQVLAGALGLSGTPDLPREKLRVRLEEIVGTFSVSADRFNLRFSVDTFPVSRDAAVDLLHDLVLGIVPDPEAVHAERDRVRARVVQRFARPNGVSQRAFRDLLMPGDVRVRRATPDTIDAIDGKTLEAALARHRDPRRLILVVSGPFDETTANRIRHKFGAWKPGEGEVPAIPGELEGAAGTGLHVMDYDSSQGYVVIGARTVSAANERYPAVWVLRSVLARRIFNRIRSNEGLAYQASARLADDWHVPSLLSVVFQTKNPSAPYGISLALEEIARMAIDGPTEGELETARQAHRASLERALGRSSSRAGAFAELTLNGAPADWYPKVRAAIEGITREEVRAVAREFLPRSNLLIVCVGKHGDMAAGDGEHAATLGDFGPITALVPPVQETGAKTPSSVVERIIRALAQGNTEALAAYAAGGFAERLAEPDAKERLASQARFLSQATWEVGDTVTDGDDATVAVDFEMARGEEKILIVMEFRMTRVEGRWRCVGFQPQGK